MKIIFLTLFFPLLLFIKILLLLIGFVYPYSSLTTRKLNIDLLRSFFLFDLKNKSFINLILCIRSVQQELSLLRFKFIINFFQNFINFPFLNLSLDLIQRMQCKLLIIIISDCCQGLFLSILIFLCLLKSFNLFCSLFCFLLLLNFLFNLSFLFLDPLDSFFQLSPPCRKYLLMFSLNGCLFRLIRRSRVLHFFILEL